MIHQEIFQAQTCGRGTYDITQAVAQIIAKSGIDSGLCHLLILHTSASLVLCENADSSVRNDLEKFMERLVPDGDPMFDHTSEGPDDMPAHIRSVLSKMDLTIPVMEGKIMLGTWQGIYLWEHRTRTHRRKIAVTVMGDNMPAEQDD
jgi:secondary thiamine-phosphate synthase enzyme